jgi:uncharacterized protein (DUF1697 family)
MRHVALLRGVNLGPRNKVPMKRLAAMFEAAGCDDVRTFIASGNVVFDAPAALAKKLPVAISSTISDELGLTIPVLVRTASEMSKIAASHPFDDDEGVHVAFLQTKPKVTTLDTSRSPGDEAVVLGREVYLRFPHGMGRSKLSVTYVDKTLGTVSTWRNWRTVTKLAELASG